MPSDTIEVSSTAAPAASQAFTNVLFDYGGPLDITVDENKTLQSNVSAFKPFIDAHHHWVSGSLVRQRHLFSRNRLGVDERVLARIEDPREYWTTLLSICPPRPWINPRELVNHLGKCRPLDHPSNSVLWRSLRNWLDEAILNGYKSKWAGNPTPSLDPMDEAMWEAARIIGDSTAGFGTFPEFLKSKAMSAGMGWFLVHPQARQIPTCWSSWAVQLKFTHANPKPKATLGKRKHGSIPSPNCDTPPKDAKRPPLARATRSTKQTSSTAACKTAPLKRKMIEDTTETPFVEPETPATMALQALLDMDISRNEEEDVWSDAIAAIASEKADPKVNKVLTKHESLVRVCQRVGAIKTANTRKETAQMIKSMFVSGTLDTRIRRIMHESLQRAGIEDNPQLRSTVTDIMLQINEVYYQQLKDMNDVLKRQEIAISDLTARVEALARIQAQLKIPTTPKSRRELKSFWE